MTAAGAGSTQANMATIRPNETGVETFVEYVGVGRRAGAVIIDGIIWFFGFGFVIALITGNTTGIGFNLEGGSALLVPLLGFVYHVVLEATNGATIGKRILGLYVTKIDGGAAGWKASFIRNLLRIVDGIAFYLVAAILVWKSYERQRLGDRLAGTVVIRR